MKDSSFTLSVFGIQEKKVRKAAEALNPISVEALHDRVEIAVSTEKYEESIRSLHRALIE